jgi:hypothetical protein
MDVTGPAMAFPGLWWRSNEIQKVLKYRKGVRKVRFYRGYYYCKWLLKCKAALPLKKQHVDFDLVSTALSCSLRFEGQIDLSVPFRESFAHGQRAWRKATLLKKN